MIPFNVPCSVGTEMEAVKAAISSGHISSNGPFTQKVKTLLAQKLGFKNVFPTHSGTGALEMAALLCRFQAGDEVILPSFTHVGTANAFERAGAKLVFADCLENHPNLSLDAVIPLINSKTKALILVHYAGTACDMEAFQALCKKHGIILIEDAAHAIGAKYRDQYLGTFGEFAAFSFHETKNITCGQGGMLLVNNLGYLKRAEILWANGTNRAAFLQGEVAQYTWVDTGSCFSMSDLNAAYLSAQLDLMEEILTRRIKIWNRYYSLFHQAFEFSPIRLPEIPFGSELNGHIFYLELPEKAIRNHLIQFLADAGILAVFHYIPLHSSPHFAEKHGDRVLRNCEKHSNCLVRLPLFDSLSQETQDYIIAKVIEWNNTYPFKL